MKISVCGLDCKECDFYQTQCDGCQEVMGKPFWTETGCELFICCTEKDFNTCGDCHELPCKQFIELKDPNIGQEQHLKEVENRVNRLKTWVADN
ncbi:MAG: DUF3795 domain-containing protein [Firmicutes bacterium]|nr:DUF3795 domain-containing protein [Bacillota bacterium]